MNIPETIEFVKDSHHKSESFDKSGDIPYYWHLCRVMLRIKDASDSEQKIALLHDILEDTNITEQDLVSLGYTNFEVENVKLCSNNFHKDKTFLDWMAYIADTSISSQRVKISDIGDNLSFERLIGLNKALKNDKPKKQHQYPLVNRINKTIEVKNNSTCIGLIHRYYKGLDILLANSNDSILNNINIGSFSKLAELQNLFKLIGENESHDYIKKIPNTGLNINTYVKIAYDKNGSEYLVAPIDNNTGNLFQTHLSSTINTEEPAKKQQERDKEQYHITIVSVAEYGMLKKIIGTDNINNIISNYGEISVVAQGIGKSLKNNNNSYHVVVSSGWLDTIRNKFNLKEKNFHITIGFDNKDNHNVPKNKKTIFIPIKDILKTLIHQPNLNISLEKKLKP